MIIVLLDDSTIMLFGSTDKVMIELEAIDIENEEYLFCDEHGQRFLGVVTTKPRGWFRQDEFLELRPVGEPDVANAIALVDRAVFVCPNEWFADLASLRGYLVSRESV